MGQAHRVTAKRKRRKAYYKRKKAEAGTSAKTAK